MAFKMASQQLQRNSSRCPHSWTSCRAKDNCCVSTKLFVQVPEADWIIMAHQRCGLSCASDWHASLMINLRRYESCVCTGGMPRTTRLTCAKGPLLFEVTNRPHHTRLVSNASSRIIKPYPYKSPAMLCRKAVLAAIVLAALAICVDAAVDLPVATEVRGPWNYFPRRCRACTGHLEQAGSNPQPNLICSHYRHCPWAKIWRCSMPAHAARTKSWVQRQGTQQWAATVARAMSYGAKDHAGAMSNLQSFQSKVMDNLAKTVLLLQDPCVAPINVGACNGRN